MSYINSSQLVDITKISVTNEDNVDGVITRAQVELNSRLGKTSDFAGTENDYKLIQRALAFLAAYYIRLERKEQDYAKFELTEYERIIKRLAIDVKEPGEQEYFEPTMDVVTQQGIYSKDTISTLD